ncbi:MAG: hypothetical protein ACKOSR_07210, partial [Flavobacteriales bacterium]
MKRILFLAAIILLILESCSIQKRHYLPGYHIEWNGKKTHREAISAATHYEQGKEDKALAYAAELSIEQSAQPET